MYVIKIWVINVNVIEKNYDVDVNVILIVIKIIINVIRDRLIRL